MTATQPVNREGLKFKKLDLHVHTPASKCFGDKSVTPEAIVQAALSKGLHGIAITDHNSGEWIDKIKAAAQATPLVVFPGAEITCMGGLGGIHIIAIFDPREGTREVESLLGNLGLKPDQYGDTETVVKKDPLQVAETVKARDGLVILAHANSSKGVLCDMRGQQRTALIQCPAVKGAEATDFQDVVAARAHKRVIDLLDGSDPTFRRKLAVYQASDNPTGAGDGKHASAGIGTRCAFFKLDQINLEGLEQCLADPDVRIRQDFELSSSTYPTIKNIKITGGFLDGAAATFHQGLNSVLGAKGAGKSLLVEFLRFALNQPSANPEILQDHNSKLATRLENYGSIQVLISDETGRDSTITRLWDPAENHPYTDQVRDPADTFPVLFLSQNEIIKIAESEDEQIAFIDRFFDFRAFQQEIADLELRLEKLDESLAECLAAYRTQSEIEQTIAVAQKEMAELDVSLKNPVFDQYTKQETKDRALRDHQIFLASLLEALNTTRGEYALNEVPQPPEACSTDPAVRRAVDVTTAARSIVLDGIDNLIAQLVQRKQQLDSDYATWVPNFQTAKKIYAEAVQKMGGDYRNLAQKRAKTIKQLEAAQQRLIPIKQKSDQIRDMNTRRAEAIAELKRAYERYSKERQVRCSKIEQESAGRLLVRIHESSNTDDFRTRLTALKRGSYLRDAEIDAICQKADPGTFVRGVIRHVVFGKPQSLEELADAVSIDKARMLTLSQFLGTEFPVIQLLALEHKALPKDRPEIKYNVGGSTFETLDRLSVGQKCTAMLIVALNEGTSPIVIDQPEDSVDIRTIWEDMCVKVRHGKERRQFIFTTHNSSLAVASDTDKFTILEADAVRGRVMYSGSMDHQPVNEEVIKYLEGGAETYKTKYKKYRIDRTQ